MPDGSWCRCRWCSLWRFFMYTSIIHLHSSSPPMNVMGRIPVPATVSVFRRTSIHQPSPSLLVVIKFTMKRKTFTFYHQFFLRFSFYFHSEIWFRTSSDTKSLNLYKLSVLLLLRWIFMCIFIYFSFPCTQFHLVII